MDKKVAIVSTFRNTIITDESLNKRRQSLLEFTISRRYRNHYLWLLTKSYLAIPKNLRRQAKAIFVWYPKEGAYLKMIHNENNVLTNDELIIVRDFWRPWKHTCLYIRNEYPRKFRVLNHVWGDDFMVKWLQLDSNSHHLVCKWTLNHLAIWVFIYELSSSAFESSCSHLDFTFSTCFKQRVPWHSGNYGVWIHSKTCTLHEKNIQSILWWAYGLA